MRICILDLCAIPREPAAFAALAASLPFGQEERERLLSLRNPDSARRSLGAALALFELIKEQDSKALTVRREMGGKPYFSDRPDLPFSLTHTEDFSAAALSEQEGLVGLDIELIRHDRNIHGIASRFFSPEEREALAAASDSALCFTHIWTQKEALAKRSGQGLAAQLGKKSFSPSCQIRHVRLTLGTKDAVLCVAAEHPIQTLSIHTASDSVRWQKS